MRLFEEYDELDEDEDADDFIQQERKKYLAERLRMLNKLKDFLLKYYKPIENLQEQDALHLSSSEIYEQLFTFYPNADLSVELIASWLNTAGFTFYDFGNMKFEWMMKKVN